MIAHQHLASHQSCKIVVYLDFVKGFLRLLNIDMILFVKKKKLATFLFINRKFGMIAQWECLSHERHQPIRIDTVYIPQEYILIMRLHKYGQILSESTASSSWWIVVLDT